MAARVLDAPQKKAIILHLSGREIRDIYKTLKQDDGTCETICQKLTDYFRLHKNLTYERFQFKQGTKKMDECVTSYITKLKNLALHCEFQNQDEEVKDTFVATCHDINLKCKLLKVKDLTFKKWIAIDKERDSIAVELREMETKDRDTDLELLSKVSKSKRKIEKRKEKHQRKSKHNCFKYCNEFTPGHLKNCSALGRKCYICSKLNHLASICRSKEQDQVKYKNSKSKKVNKVENTTSN